MKTFTSRCADLRPHVESIDRAWRAVRGSRRLRNVLATVLAVGNYMNYGKRTGNAYGE
jgi:hypothetical protein